MIDFPPEKDHHLGSVRASLRVVRPDELERRLRKRLDALGPAPRAELLRVLMLPDFERANRIGEFSTDGVLRSSAPPGLNAYVRLYERMQCTALWIEMSALALTNIMDQVRSRVLAFALEIEQANPRAGDKPPDGAGPAVPIDTVSNIYNTTIYGGVNAVATGSGSASQVASVNITPGHVPALLDYLRALGVGADDVAELEDALATDAEEGDGEGFGPQVTAWLGRASMKVATGTMKLAGSAGAELLALAVAKHLGII